MALIVQSIVAQVKATLTAMTTATDDGAPVTWIDSPHVDVEQSPNDRVFHVEPGDGPIVRDITGLSGVAHRSMEFSVKLRVINEGRSATDFVAILFEDICRIQDRVPPAVMGIVGVDVCLALESPQPQRAALESEQWLCEVPFRVEWHDDIPSS